VKRLFLLLAFLSVSASVRAGAVIRTVPEFSTAVREATNIYSTTALPDSTLLLFDRMAILETSVEVGGVEATYRFVTDSADPFYPLPDTTVAVLFTTILTKEGNTKSLKGWYPQYFEDLRLPALEASSEDATPVAYLFWGDSIQLLPIPVRVDTIYMYCAVEHPRVGASDTLSFTRPAYTNAAVLLAAEKVFFHLGMFEEASLTLAAYEKKAEKLRAIYTRAFDVIKKE
jgi:hypothetical protein